MTADTPVALVTGGSGGIGTALTRRLLADGYRVVIADLAVPMMTDVHFLKTDVTMPAAHRAAVDGSIARYGRLDTVFLNAGVTSEGLDFGEGLDINAYHQALAVNLDGVVFGIDAAMNHAERAGLKSIVVTASLAGIMPVPTDPIYAATKHAVVGLVRSLGRAVAPVRINAVCPTYTNTPMLNGVRDEVIAAGAPILTPDTVSEALLDVSQAVGSGDCYFVQVGRPTGRFEFRRPPGPR